MQLKYNFTDFQEKPRSQNWCRHSDKIYS